MNRRKILMAASGVGAVGLGVATTLDDRKSDVVTAPLLQERNLASKKPNILLIVVDQMRSLQDLPSNLPLPGINRLRELGISYKNFYVNTTPCSPSRSTLYFGRHTQHTRMTANLGAPPFASIARGLPSIGHLLRAQGYYTAYKGKWHLSPMKGVHDLTYGEYPNSKDALEQFGFSDFNIDGDPHGSTWTGYRFDGQIAADSTEWMNTKGREINAAKKPWFMAVNFVNPHDVMYFSSGASQEESRVSPNMLAPLKGAPNDVFYNKINIDINLPSSLLSYSNLEEKPSAHAAYRAFCDKVFGYIDLKDEAAWMEYLKYYYACICDVDRHIDTLIANLKKQDLFKDTVVVLTSDHGEMAGSHGLRQKGPFAYRENMCVPFIVAHPDGSKGQETGNLGSTIDILPTLMSIAGVDTNVLKHQHPGIKGHDLSPGFLGAGRTERDANGCLLNYGVGHYSDPEYAIRVLQLPKGQAWSAPFRFAARAQRPLPNLEQRSFFRGIYNGRHKFVRYFSPMEHHFPQTWKSLTERNELELYDLKSDPIEVHNLAHDSRREKYKELIVGLNERLNDLLRTEVGPDNGAEHPYPQWMQKGDAA